MREETHHLYELLEKLRVNPTIFTGILNLFYDYGIKKSWVTPKEETLRQYARWIKNNRDENENVTIEDVELALETIRQMVKIDNLIGHIVRDGYSVDVVWDQWRLCDEYFY